MADFRMPALGADMEHGRLVQWRVAPGARVQPGDVVAVVETQKGAIDVEIFLAGVIDELVPVGTELPVGALLARVREEGATGAAPSSTPAVPPPAPLPSPMPQALPPSGSPLRATPGARRRAAQAGLALAGVQGTGPQASITLADVERAAATPAAASPPAPRGFDPAQMRGVIAAAMARSKREIPHYYLTQAMDFGAAQDWLARYNAGREPAGRMLAAAVLLKATAVALARVPQLNGFFRDGQVQLSKAVHVGWAVALRGGGLLVPAIHHADQRTLPDLMAALADVVRRARAGGLRSSELADSTVTVTNLGDLGADGVLGVIYPPQLALVGFGRIAPRPWVADGQLAVRPLVQASLAADHRASDGHLGARFLTALDAALQQPETLAGSPR